jgi:hypothetical protein
MVVSNPEVAGMNLKVTKSYDTCSPGDRGVDKPLKGKVAQAFRLSP